MSNSKITDVEHLLKIIADLPEGCTVAATGSGGGLVEPDEAMSLFEAAFLKAGTPRNMTFVHALGMGDGVERGTNRFAHEGMVRRVIGGHWTWSPRMLAMVRSGAIEAYAWPSGAIVHLLREIGAGRPGLITKVGLGTYVDPRATGGRASSSATEDLIEVIEIGGEEYLRYLPFSVDVGIVRGTYADQYGNIYSSEEAADLDGYEIALAAHNSGGRVIAQVREIRDAAELRAREVLIPGQLVDNILVAPGQWQTYLRGYDAFYSGLRKGKPEGAVAQITDPARLIVARRAAMELQRGGVLNFGFGMSADVAGLLDQLPHADEFWRTVEQGLHNGQLLGGNLFGISAGPTAIVSSAQQFDFYSGKGLDQTYLGMGEFDEKGCVNVSHLAGRLSGPGGFIDISQGAKEVIFCGRFNAKGTALRLSDGKLCIDHEGSIRKAVDSVHTVTFSGGEAVKRGQRVLYITERAVFQLTPEGVELIEVAQGLDLERDVLAQMGFSPLIKAPGVMPAECFVSSSQKEI
ncbi:MAG: CoA-transferase [Pseudomonadota bacterium]